MPLLALSYLVTFRHRIILFLGGSLFKVRKIWNIWINLWAKLLSQQYASIVANAQTDLACIWLESENEKTIQMLTKAQLKFTHYRHKQAHTVLILRKRCEAVLPVPIQYIVSYPSIMVLLPLLCLRHSFSWSHPFNHFVLQSHWSW